jgi:hypothetical protein
MISWRPLGGFFIPIMLNMSWDTMVEHASTYSVHICFHIFVSHPDSHSPIICLSTFAYWCSKCFEPGGCWHTQDRWTDGWIFQVFTSLPVSLKFVDVTVHPLLGVLTLLNLKLVSPKWGFLVGSFNKVTLPK